jgi:hypothetical protein
MAQVTVSIEESNTPDLCRALLDRTLDIAVIRPPHRNRAAFRSLPDRGTDPDRAAQRSSALRARAAAAQRHRQRTAHHFSQIARPGLSRQDPERLSGSRLFPDHRSGSAPDRGDGAHGRRGSGRCDRS